MTTLADTAEQLKLVRQQAGLSQTELARRADGFGGCSGRFRCLGAEAYLATRGDRVTQWVSPTINRRSWRRFYCAVRGTKLAH